MNRALVFGWGYLGAVFARRLRAAGWTVAVTSRDPDKRKQARAEGLTPCDPSDPAALIASCEAVDAVLIAAPPAPDGCPGVKTLLPALVEAGSSPAWIGYISTTGVYGDRGGGWVFEDSELNAPTVEGARRAAAERDWLAAGGRLGAPVCIFRLPAIYGPGRSPFDRLREGTARIVRKPGQVFNRIHVEDACAAMLLSLAKPRAGAIYNVCDDQPAGADVYTAFAAEIAGLPLPPETDWTAPDVSEGMRRFYKDNKRVSNALAKAELGWRPAYPDWRDGLRAVLAAKSA